MSDRLPNIGESPFGKRSPFLNDLQGQQKESSVTRLRKTIKAEQHLPTSETENGKKRDIDHSAKNLDRKLNSNQFEQVNSTHLIEKKNPFTLNDVMSTLSNEGIEYEYDLLENNYGYEFISFLKQNASNILTGEKIENIDLVKYRKKSINLIFNISKLVNNFRNK